MRQSAGAQPSQPERAEQQRQAAAMDWASCGEEEAVQ